MARFKILKTLLLSCLAMLCANSAQAIVYECKAEQAFYWKHGRLKSDSIARHMIFELDDKNGVLTSGGPPPYQTWYSNIHIFNKLSPTQDLEADSMSIINERFGGNTYFRISSWEKDLGLVFMYSVRDSIFSGHCVIDKKLKSLPSPELIPSIKIYPPLQNDKSQPIK